MLPSPSPNTSTISACTSACCPAPQPHRRPAGGPPSSVAELDPSSYLHLLLSFLAPPPPRMTLLFFVISGLDLLGALDDISSKQREDIIEWIYAQQVVPSEDGRLSCLLLAAVSRRLAAVSLPPASLPQRATLTSVGSGAPRSLVSPTRPTRSASTLLACSLEAFLISVCLSLSLRVRALPILMTLPTLP